MTALSVIWIIIFFDMNDNKTKWGFFTKLSNCEDTAQSFEMRKDIQVDSKCFKYERDPNKPGTVVDQYLIKEVIPNLTPDNKIEPKKL